MAFTWYVLIGTMMTFCAALLASLFEKPGPRIEMRGPRDGAALE